MAAGRQRVARTAADLRWAQGVRGNYGPGLPVTEYPRGVFCDGRNLNCLHNSHLLLVENDSAFPQSPLTMGNPPSSKKHANLHEMPVAAVP